MDQGAGEKLSPGSTASVIEGMTNDLASLSIKAEIKVEESDELMIDSPDSEIEIPAQKPKKLAKNKSKGQKSKARKRRAAERRLKEAEEKEKFKDLKVSSDEPLSESEENAFYNMRDALNGVKEELISLYSELELVRKRIQEQGIVRKAEEVRTSLTISVLEYINNLSLVQAAEINTKSDFVMKFHEKNQNSSAFWRNGRFRATGTRWYMVGKINDIRGAYMDNVHIASYLCNYHESLKSIDVVKREIECSLHKCKAKMEGINSSDHLALDNFEPPFKDWVKKLCSIMERKVNILYDYLIKEGNIMNSPAFERGMGILITMIQDIDSLFLRSRCLVYGFVSQELELMDNIECAQYNQSIMIQSCQSNPGIYPQTPNAHFIPAPEGVPQLLPPPNAMVQEDTKLCVKEKEEQEKLKKEEEEQEGKLKEEGENLKSLKVSCQQYLSESKVEVILGEMIEKFESIREELILLFCEINLACKELEERGVFIKLVELCYQDNEYMRERITVLKKEKVNFVVESILEFYRNTRYILFQDKYGKIKTGEDRGKVIRTFDGMNNEHNRQNALIKDCLLKKDKKSIDNINKLNARIEAREQDISRMEGLFHRLGNFGSFVNRLDKIDKKIGVVYKNSLLEVVGYFHMKQHRKKCDEFIGLIDRNNKLFFNISVMIRRICENENPHSTDRQEQFYNCSSPDYCESIQSNVIPQFPSSSPYLSPVPPFIGSHACHQPYGFQYLEGNPYLHPQYFDSNVYPSFPAMPVGIPPLPPQTMVQVDEHEYQQFVGPQFMQSIYIQAPHAHCIPAPGGGAKIPPKITRQCDASGTLYDYASSLPKFHPMFGVASQHVDPNPYPLGSVVFMPVFGGQYCLGPEDCPFYR